MRRKLTWVVLLSAAIMVTALFHASPAWATPANGFASTPLAQGQFDQFNIFNSFVLPDSQVWLSRQWTKGLSDGAVLINVWQPGGSTGWHTHPGHTLIFVTAGTVTRLSALAQLPPPIVSHCFCCCVQRSSGDAVPVEI